MEDFHALQDRVERGAVRRDGWTLFMSVFAALALVLGVVGIGFGARAVDDAKRTVASAAVPTAATVAAGKAIFEITNAGAMPHKLLVFRSDLAPSAYPMKDGNIDEEGPGITKVSDGDNLDPGTSQTRTLDLTQPGTYMFVCNLPDHFKAGMFQIVTVK